MKESKTHLLVMLSVFALVLLAPHAVSAQGLIAGTVASFSAPFEVPGHVLPAGTYSFVQKGSTIVQIWDKTQSTLFATLITNAAQKSQFAEEREEFEFEPLESNKPLELKAWFLDGQSLGHEFIYSK